MKFRAIKRLAALAVTTVLLSNCHKPVPTVFKEIEIDGRFSLHVPAYLQTTKELVPYTSTNFHQYQDSVGRVCLLIFDTARENFEVTDLKTFYDSMVSRTVLDSARITPAKLIKVDGDSTYRSEVAGMHNGVWIFSEIETIATKDRFYNIVTWSSFDRRDKLRDDMIKMLNSFHDINHVKK